MPVAFSKFMFRALRSYLYLPWVFGSACLAAAAPVPGSALPDAWGRAGGQVILTVAEVTDRTVTVGGVPASSASSRVTITIPPGTAPGRLRVLFVARKTDQTLTSRDIEVLPPPSGSPDDRRLQLLLDPRLTGAQAQALLTRLLPGLGSLSSLETLPTAQAPGSPCGGTLAEVELGAGVALENALNQLAQQGGSDVWYPDPITRWSAPALAQAQSQAQSQAQTQVTTPASPLSFGYLPAPVVPRTMLGTAGSGLSGAGVTIAVLDTGFSSPLDTRHELTDAQGNLLSRVQPPVNALLPYDPVNPGASLLGAEDFWEGHGTQVAMLAAGQLSGVAPGASVLPIKVCSPGNAQATCRTKDVLRGLCLALKSVPANRLVLNLSLGGSAPTGAIHAVLNWAAQHGALVVAAGGNQHGLSATDPEEYPAAFARSHAPSQVALPLMAVASVSPVNVGGRVPISGAAWHLSSFSTRGSYLNLSAPGEALDLGHNQLYSGTSFAAPLVSGAAALARQTNLAASAAAVQAFMLGGNRIELSGGAALSSLATSPSPSLQPPMLRLSGY